MERQTVASHIHWAGEFVIRRLDDACCCSPNQPDNSVCIPCASASYYKHTRTLGRLAFIRACLTCCLCISIILSVSSVLSCSLALSLSLSLSVCVCLSPSLSLTHTHTFIPLILLSLFPCPTRSKVVTAPECGANLSATPPLPAKTVHDFSRNLTLENMRAVAQRRGGEAYTNATDFLAWYSNTVIQWQ